MTKTILSSIKKILVTASLIPLINETSFAQSKSPYDYVNPFIGTSKSDVITKWGDNGGTYPGAVAPSGFVQLTPETSVTGNKGYSYHDSSIYFFSCYYHKSGFPGQAAGRLYIIPVDDTKKQFIPFKYSRPFSHKHEKATPGYYKVLFTDNGTTAEATTSIRAGMFRFTFPDHVVPKIFIADTGSIHSISKNNLFLPTSHAAINFNVGYIEKEKKDSGYLFSFAASNKPVEIILKISVSTIDEESAQKNINTELSNISFDALRERTKKSWAKELSVVEIEDDNDVNKTIFYTALYHSLLMPWISSDVEGNYRGKDSLIHKSSGKVEYAYFSPWDEFRSLHPMLCLLYPDKQSDMILSMIDIYKQSGRLPTESMTGNHSVAIIVDSYLKGIKGIDKNVAYAAMKKSIVDPPFKQNDLETYQQKGYVSFLNPESVTRTMEYAYDDWALSQFSKLVMHDQELYATLIKRSFNYRNLFNADERLFLPRNDNEFKLEPGNSGYKEGDKWVYSFFVPQNPKDLINLMGGNNSFAARIDGYLTTKRIIFDNETVFHIPYLFNEANHPELTQKWSRWIMQYRFNATPGGLPGNDDLGAMSSWYVLSAMGIFPECPGRPYYSIGSPIFHSITLHLKNGKKFIIRSVNNSPQNIYVKSLSLNHHPYFQTSVPHSMIMQDGEMVFTMTNSSQQKKQTIGTTNIFSETKNEPSFSIFDFSISNKKVKPGELFWVYFSIKNSGAAGSKTVEILNDGQDYNYKTCIVKSGELLRDSIGCQLYPFGKTKLSVEGKQLDEIDVVDDDTDISDKGKITLIDIKPTVLQGEWQDIFYEIKNIGGAAHTFCIPVLLNDSLIHTDTITLYAGQNIGQSRQIRVYGKGLQTIHIKDQSKIFKIYQSDKDAEILNLSFDKIINDSIVADRSGFNNNGKIIRQNKNENSLLKDSLLLFGKDCFVEIPNSPSLDKLDESMTMMIWVYATEEDKKGLVDIFTNGDNHVIQISKNKDLTFFAGGWGRGDCTIDLPKDWKNEWHHIAGVCDGKKLQLYIDGILKKSVTLDISANLSTTSKWVIGRNEEFPLKRIFNGYIKKAKLFARPLSEEEIKNVMNE